MKKKRKSVHLFNWLRDWLINFNGMSTPVVLFYA